MHIALGWPFRRAIPPGKVPVPKPEKRNRLREDVVELQRIVKGDPELHHKGILDQLEDLRTQLRRQGRILVLIGLWITVLVLVGDTPQGQRVLDLVLKFIVGG